MKNLIFIILFISLNIFASENKKIVLQISWLHQFQFAGYYMAKELGYYRDIGIDLEIKEYSYNTKVIDRIENKEAHFAIAHSALFIDKIKGKDIVALGAIFQSSPLVLLVREDIGINSVKDLKNKKIMMTNNSITGASILAMLNANGLTKKDINIISHSFDFNDLINKKTDAMVSYLSNEPIRLEEKNIGYKIFYPKEYGFNFYSDILFTSSEFIKNNPSLTKDFYMATLKGWKYAFDNIVKTSELIYKKYNTQNKPLISYVKEGEVLKTLAYYNKNSHLLDSSLGHLDKERIAEIVNTYKVLGFVSNDLKVDEFIYEHNHPKTVDMHLTVKEIAIGITSVVLMLFILFYSMKKKKWLLTKKELEKEVQLQKEEINKKNRLLIVHSKISAVSEMLGNIAHQWRQPLAVITSNMAYMQLHVELDEDMSKKQCLKTVSKVNEQCQYLSNIIDDFRNFFDEHSINSSKFNLKDAIEKANELEKDVFRNSFIEVVLYLIDCDIIENQNTFIQSLLNLFNNAKDAMSFNNIPSENRYFFITMKKDNEKIVIIFTDSGGGVDENIIDNIFEPYFTTKYKSRGTGLGLYMTHQIITKHLNGEISVSNKEFEYKEKRLKGTEFIIELPLN